MTGLSRKACSIGYINCYAIIIPVSIQEMSAWYNNFSKRFYFLNKVVDLAYYFGSFCVG